LQSGQNLSALFEVLGREMIYMEDSVRRLMRSRWYGTAAGWEEPDYDPVDTELGKIGALFGCLPGSGESTNQFRRRLADFVLIHWKDGLGTVSSILKLVALVYRAEKSPDKIEWQKNTAVAKFDVHDGSGTRRTLQLKLMENPQRTYVDPGKDRICNHNSDILVVNRGLDRAIPKIELTATYGSVAVPMLIHEETGTHLLYAGFIPKGVCLTLEDGKPPLLNGRPRKDFLQRYSRFDQAKFETQWSGARYADSDQEESDAVLIGHGFRFNSARFASLESRVQVQFVGFGKALHFPLLMRGANNWHYRVVYKDELNSFLENIKNLSDRQRDELHETGLINLEDLGDANLEKLLEHAWDPPPDHGDSINAPPAIDLKFIWQSRVPACYVLRIPDYVPPHFRKQAVNRALEKLSDDLRQAVNEALEKGSDDLKQAVNQALEKGSDDLKQAVNRALEKGSDELKQAVDEALKKGSDDLKTTVNQALEEGSDELNQAVNEALEKGSDDLKQAVNRALEEGSDLLSQAVNRALAYGSAAGVKFELET
jgi:hypothetical protein